MLVRNSAVRGFNVFAMDGMKNTLLGNIMTGKMMTGKILDWGKYGGMSGNLPHFPGDDS